MNLFKDEYIEKVKTQLTNIDINSTEDFGKCIK